MSSYYTLKECFVEVLDGSGVARNEDHEKSDRDSVYRWPSVVLRNDREPREEVIEIIHG